MRGSFRGGQFREIQPLVKLQPQADRAKRSLGLNEFLQRVRKIERDTKWGEDKLAKQMTVGRLITIS